MQEPSHQTPVTVSSLLGLMALAIAAGRKAKDTGERRPDACEAPLRPARREEVATA